jgi:hypothetical protein
LNAKEQEHAEQAKKKEAEFAAKLAAMADSMNRAIVEKDALRDSQSSEVERQLQLRQGAWSERLTKLQKELDEQRAAYEAQRTTAMQEHHKKLMEVTEDYRTQLVQARRQVEEAELGTVEKLAKMAHDLKDAQETRDNAEYQLKHEKEAFAARLAQLKEDAAREMERAARQEKSRSERQQLEFDKNLRYKFQEQEAAFQAKQKQREEEMAIRAAARETELQNQFASDLRAREEDWERRAESYANNTEARLRHEAQQSEELFQSKSRQRDQQWQVKLDAARAETQAQADEVLRRRQAEAAAALRELEARLRKEMKQREQELTSQLNAQAQTRLADAQAQWEKESESKLELIEKERDDARETAAESARHVEAMEKKLGEATSFLNGWKNGRKTPEPFGT